MVVLSDRDIKKYLEEKKLRIENLSEDCIDPCSVDLRLGNSFRIFRKSEITHIDTKEGIREDLMELVEKKDGDSFTIHPGELVLGMTKEYVKIPRDLVATLDGRSSLGRLGIVVHSTANSFDPGFEGHPTLEISNISTVPVVLWPGSRVCRMSFTKLSSPAEVSYAEKKGKKYKKQAGPERSRINED